MYTFFLKPILFKFDPERVHNFFVRIGSFLGNFLITRRLTAYFFNYTHSVLEQDVLGLHFKNPIGLSAGFDKNAQLTDILPSVGFGFVEVGSITGEYCPGNPSPRLWRLKKSQSIVVNYGLKNDGCEAISKRLTQKKFAIPVGTSVAMTNCQDTLDISKAIEDYAKAFSQMKEVASYITINISCPNTVGGQPFVDSQNLHLLLSRLDTIPTQKPIFIKLSPDLSLVDLDNILSVARSHRIDGIICVNLTKKRTNPKILEEHVPEKGGLSGKVVQELSDKMLAHVYKKAGDRFVLIGSGGVFTAEDAYTKIRLGASLVQIMTGMIFEGPQVVKKINKGLVKLLKRDGFATLTDAIGVDIDKEV